VQKDTLFTPWVSFAGSAQLDFLSCYGNLAWGDDSAADTARVLYRVNLGSGLYSNWSLVAEREDLAVLVPDSDTLHGMWTSWSFELDPAEAGEYLQVAFVYHGAWTWGWALDEIRVGPVPQAQPPGWDGPPRARAELGRIYPNPFNPVTRVPYRLRERGPLRITVHNLLGQQVAELLHDPRHPAGTYALSFQPEGLSSGIYFIRLEAAGELDVRRLLYLK